MGLRTFPGKFLVRVWSLVAIRAEMSKQYNQTCPNLSTIQWPCTLYAQCLFLHYRMLLFFSITFYPAEIAYFNSPNRELASGVRVMALYWSKIVDPSRSPCLKTVDRKSELCHFLFLHPILVKLHLLACLIKSFSTVYSLCSCIEIKMSIPLGANA